VLGAILGTVVAVPYLYHRVDEEIRRRVEGMLAQHYRGLRVQIRSAQLREGEGIELRGLRFLEPGAQGPRAELLHIEEVFLTCRGDLQELIGGQPEIRRVVVRRPVLRVVRQPDGSWSAGRLLPLPRFSSHSPETCVEDGLIEIVDASRGAASVFTLRDVNLALGAPLPSDGIPAGSHVRRLKGTLGGDFLRQVSVVGLVDPHQASASLTGSVAGLEISPELRGALPEPLAAKLAELGSLRAQAKLTFALRLHPAANPVVHFDVTGQLSQGSLDDPRLPHPLNDLRAGFRVTNEGLAVNALFATAGTATLHVSSFRRAGFGPQSPQWLEADVRSLELDRRLLGILPLGLQHHWYHYLPTGQIHANLKLAGDGRTWQPEVSVECQNVSFSYHKFPYRLQQAKGSVLLKDDELHVNLMAYSGSQPVRISGKIRQPLTAPVGEMNAQGESLAVDEKLLTALPGRSRAVVRALNPHGTIRSFSARVWREKAEEPWRKSVVARVANCSIRYDRFPYPLTNIQGTLELLDDQWTFRDLSGTNDTGLVTCGGRLTPVPDGVELVLGFHGVNVPLENELRDALGQPNMQQVWNDLHLQGMIDLDADVYWRTGMHRPIVTFRAGLHSENTSIEPVYFPCRLDKLSGLLVYREGQVTVEKLRAQRGTAAVSSSARCTFLPDGSWHLSLENLCVDRLHLDRELMQALPQRLKRTVLELNPTGPLGLAGTFEVARGGRPADPITSRWDLDVGFCQGSVDCGLKLENLNGSMKLVGDFDGRHFQSRGEFDVDSVSFRNAQFTQVRGPFWIDDEQVLFGVEVDRFSRTRPGAAGPAGSPRPISARLFGGTLFGNGWIALGPVPRYEFNANLAQADLSRCAQEMMPGRQDLTGQILATVNLRGAGRSLNSLAGFGNIHLRNANIYELPVMIALLKILSIREPDRTAFSESDIRFRIEGPHFYLDPVNFSGDAISLEGKGEMDFAGAVRLRFRAQLGRNDLRLPVIRDVLGGASEQIMIIHVDGTLQDPVTRREPFPVVQEALEGLRAADRRQH